MFTFNFNFTVRLLIHGNSSDCGQTSYVLPVVVNCLDHLPVFSLSIASLFSSGIFRVFCFFYSKIILKFKIYPCYYHISIHIIRILIFIHFKAHQKKVFRKQFNLQYVQHPQVLHVFFLFHLLICGIKPFRDLFGIWFVISLFFYDFLIFTVFFQYII